MYNDMHLYLGSAWLTMGREVKTKYFSFSSVLFFCGNKVETYSVVGELMYLVAHTHTQRLRSTDYGLQISPFSGLWFNLEMYGSYTCE